MSPSFFTIIGVDTDSKLINEHSGAGRNVLRSDPSDPDFWEKIDHMPPFEIILLALPNLQATLGAINQIK